MSFEAIVIGGGPAGTSAAIGLLRSGYKVTLIEKNSSWQGRVCGSFLSPEAVTHLKWLNVLEPVNNAGGVTINKSTVTTSLNPQGTLIPFGHQETAMGLSRFTLETILIEAVKAEGGCVLLGTRAVGLRKENQEWVVKAHTLGELKAPILVIADGRFTIGRNNGRKLQTGWYGWNATFSNVEQINGELSLHFYPGGYVGLLTYANGETNVCGLKYRKFGKQLLWDDVYTVALKQHPGLKNILSQARRISDWQGVGPLPYSRNLRQMAGSGAIFAGDAAAVGDPYTGEGIGRALATGPMIFQSIAHSKEKHNAGEITAEYCRLWKDSYAKRLNKSAWLRRILETRFLPIQVVSYFARNKKIVKTFIPKTPPLLKS